MTSLSLNSIRYAPFGSSTDHGPTFPIAKLTALLLLSNARKLVKHCLTRSTTKARPTVAAGAQTAAKEAQTAATAAQTAATAAQTAAKAAQTAATAAA